MNMVTRKLFLVFFVHTHLCFCHLYPLSFPHAEAVWEQWFMKLTMPMGVSCCYSTGGSSAPAHSE